MRGSVTVTGPPAAIWRRKIGTTEPEEPSTLPNRTVAYRVAGCLAAAASTAHSASALEAPITVAGLTALSVETSTNVPTPVSPAIRATSRVASALLRIASTGFCSIIADVLVGGGVEDDRGAVLGEHLPHPLLLLAVGQHRDRGADVAVLLELADDLEQVVLGVVHQHQSPRAHPRDLAAQLGADRAAGAGDQHDLAGQVGADPLELLADRLAAEHVLDADLAQLAGDPQLPGAVAQQLEHGRRGPDRDPARAAGGDDARPQRARRRRDRDHDLVGLDLVEHPRQVGRRCRAEHLEPVLVLDPQLAGIVVEEADRAQQQLGVAHQLAHDQAAAVAATDDQRLARALADADAAHPARR